MGAAGSQQEPREWQRPTPYFRPYDIVQLKEEVLRDAGTASYYVVDNFTGLDTPVFQNTYFLRRIDVDEGTVEQTTGIPQSPESLVPFVVAQLPLQNNLQFALMMAGTPGLLRLPGPSATDQKDCEFMENVESGVCSTDTNIASDEWCDIPPWAYYRQGSHCYDIRELLAHFNYQLTRDERHGPVPPSLPLDRQPVSAGEFEYLLIRALAAGWPVPPNVLRAMEVYRQFGIVNDPVFFYYAHQYPQLRAQHVQELSDIEFYTMAVCPVENYPSCPPLIAIRRRIAGFRPAP